MKSSSELFNFNPPQKKATENLAKRTFAEVCGRSVWQSHAAEIALRHLANYSDAWASALALSELNFIKL